jgi:universal stress protein A
MTADTSPAFPYRRILAAVDLTEDSRIIGRRARGVAAATGAALELLHVVEYLPAETLNETLLPAVEIEGELIRGARERLVQLARELGLPPSCARIEAGSTKSEILRVSAEIDADLIVIGAHERHGLSILLNMTPDTVMHAAACDVLAVRLR